MEKLILGADRWRPEFTFGGRGFRILTKNVVQNFGAGEVIYFLLKRPARICDDLQERAGAEGPGLGGSLACRYEKGKKYASNARVKCSALSRDRRGNAIDEPRIRNSFFGRPVRGVKVPSPPSPPKITAKNFRHIIVNFVRFKTTPNVVTYTYISR